MVSLVSWIVTAFTPPRSTFLSVSHAQPNPVSLHPHPPSPLQNMQRSGNQVNGNLSIKMAQNAPQSGHTGPALTCCWNTQGDKIFTGSADKTGEPPLSILCEKQIPSDANDGVEYGGGDGEEGWVGGERDRERVCRRRTDRGD